jgi:subtilisin family serine protease
MDGDMRRTSQILAGALGLVLGATLAAPDAAHGHEPAADPQPARTATVTLVTGDLVDLTTYPDGRQAASVLPAPGSARGDFQMLERHGQTYVFPESALPYLRSGLLEERLFNVTELAANGSTDLPLIVEYATDAADVAGTRKLLARAAPAGARKVRELPSVGAVAVTVPRGDAAKFWEAVDDDRPTALVAPMFDRSVRRIRLDGTVTASLDVSVPLIGAPAAWQAGYDGTGVTVAVLDTGIDTNHPDLAGKVVEAKNFTARPDATDEHGHGTHVASTVAGSGAASGGRYKGVAPGAKLLNGRVLDNRGSGSESQVIAGMEWAAARAKVVSMSLGAGATDGTDPMSEAVNRLSAQYGTLFVIAAGNSGVPQSVGAPGAAEAALTVGASTKTDTMASFSSRGPRVGDSAVKPEIVAPGASITAAKAGTNGYVAMSGTSMATPHVSGAAAIVAQRHSDRTGQQLKALLTSTATTLAVGTVYDQGAGRVDLARAISQQVTASTSALSLGRFLNPYSGHEPVSKTVSYRNDGAAEVTLDLALSATTANGVAAPADMLSLSPTTLTIPAGGTATTTVTVDPDHGEVGLYGGRLTASSRDGSTRLTTAVGFHKDVIHTLTIKAIDRTGRPAEYSRSTAFNMDTGSFQTIYTEAGQAKVQLKPGQYALFSGVNTPDGTGYQDPDVTAISNPELTINADTEVVLDARRGKPVTIRTARPTEPYAQGHQLVRRSPGVATFITGAASGGKLFVVPSQPVTRGDMEYAAAADLRVPVLTMRIAGADVVLHPRYANLDSYATSKRLDGKRRLPVVFLGAGRPDDYAGRDVRGKVALVRITAGLTIDDQVAAAAAAKAAVVAVIADGPGPFRGIASPTVALPVVGLPRSEGDELLRRLGQGKVNLDLEGTPHSPYRYEAMLPSPALPDGIDHTMDATTTALQHSKVYAVRPNQVGSYANHMFGRLRALSLAVRYERPFGFAQDEYFTANDAAYDKKVWAGYPSDHIVSLLRQFAPGTEVTKTWYKAPLRSGTNAVRPPTSRQGDRFVFTFDSYVDAEPDHVTALQGVRTAARVYRDGELVAQGPYAVGLFDVGTAQAATYRVELDVTEGRPGFAVSPEVYSAWTVRSARPAGPESVPLPVLTAAWDLGLDLGNAAPAGQAFPLRLAARTQAGAQPVPVTGARIWASFDDGGTWRKVPVDGLDGRFTGTVKHPALGDTTGYVSLRYEITDAAGGKLEQTVIRAYALK